MDKDGDRQPVKCYTLIKESYTYHLFLIYLCAMDAPEIPYMIYAEGTPNPASMKFVANKMLLQTGATAQYNNITETKQAPLAQKLFEFPFVKQVFIAANYITIIKHDF